ncbi:hypothetical protein HELRODRAFT_189521 [Helobdella robusta]|uniref:UBR-type domain-containing protein n=1 Tax=Helobdella robusta TaxID=6412 RepID=T1FR45_HELRO|nr:hypothetical protein HELRODRAFT_189521 [Helobdella robusta]ESN92599.1 hypothetical protein HELRODRAFT_189521 [Helobdella robusta]
MKLSSVKVDSKFTTSSQIVKLISSHTISKFLLRITDLKKSKMVKTLVVYYNNKHVQAILELKNKPTLWHKAKKVTLTQGQTEVKVEFSLPIVACNLMIEYAEFYDNTHSSTETLQCPRCSASVPANPGVCTNCGENVFQCHKCRAINYDEKDPFLCNSCGYCKYAKFDFTMCAKQCCAVDPIESEEDRKKAVTSINSHLDSEDILYKQLQDLKSVIVSLLVRVKDHINVISGSNSANSGQQPAAASAAIATASGGGAAATTTTSANATAAVGSLSVTINKSLQQLALKYCMECKTAFEDLSKIIQKVQATRKELVKFDRQQQEAALASMTPSASMTSSAVFPAVPPTTVAAAAASGSVATVATCQGHANAVAVGAAGVTTVGKGRKTYCYGCAISTVEHCITLLRAMSTTANLKNYLCGQGLIKELFNYNLRRGSPQIRSEVRNLLCLMSTNHEAATSDLLSLLSNNIQLAISGHFSNPDFASTVRHEMGLLDNLLLIDDDMWEERLRCVIRLFNICTRYDSPSIQDAVSLPCLRILQRLSASTATPTPQPAAAAAATTTATTSSAGGKSAKKEKSSSSANATTATSTASATTTSDAIVYSIHPPVQLTADFQGWMAGRPAASFSSWVKNLPTRVISDSSGQPPPPAATAAAGFSKKKREVERLRDRENERKAVRVRYLSEKYFNKWRFNVKLKNRITTDLKSVDTSWIRRAMFSSTSAAMRQTECDIVEDFCKVPGRKQDIIDILSDCLDEVGESGESSAEFLKLYKKLISTGHWKYYTSLKGVLNKITNLITLEINELQRLETVSLSSNLSQGFAIKSLTDLLSSFLEVDLIKQHYKNKLVGSVLGGYLSLKKLIVQRTKMIDEAQEKLLELLEGMTTGNESERKEFMSVCVETINKYPLQDLLSPVFIFERLCNIIVPEANDSKEFTLSLEKDPQQEDFLQGRMLGNPYSSNEQGLGPLMRDVKNKICQDCELVALLEDDTGMELLVNNKIISLDLAVKDVYRKIWLLEHNDTDPMRVVYRMRGLLGDATEDMVNSLETGKDSDVDSEEVYRMANVMSQCGGLKVMLQRLSSIKSLVSGKQLMIVLLKLFSYCVMVKSNRQQLIEINMNSITVMLGALNLALLAEQEMETSIKGQTLTEQILQIMEVILSEASTHLPPEVYKEFSKSCGDKDQLMVLLDRINSPFVRCNQNVLQALMKLIPFLAYGEEEKMMALVNHFKPCLNFCRFDLDHTQDEQIHLDCFCVIAQGIENNTNGRKLKDLILEKSEIVQDTLTYLLARTPKITTATGANVIMESEGWKEMISRPSLPYVIRMLTGLCRGHEAIQLKLVEIVPALHYMEQISSDECVGSLAENLLEALKENEVVAKKIEEVRQYTKQEKKRLAMAKREKQLNQLGMMTNEKGQLKIKKDILEGHIDGLKEESGLVCSICREGYKYQPNKVLGVYTFSKRVNLDDYEGGKSRKTPGYSSVTHFNIVHFDCHLAAVRHARAREEWESAALQNGNTKCNGLLPLWGPDVVESVFASCLARHNGYLQESTGIRDNSFTHTIHDLKHLLLKFTFEKSFSEDTGGGGRGSNIHLIPYLMHMALYVINTTRSSSREEKNLSNYLKMAVDKWVESSYETEGPLYWTVMASHIIGPSAWKKERVMFLKRLIVLAHVRSLSSSSCNSITDKKVKDFISYKPYVLLFALIDSVYTQLFKNCKEDSTATTWSVSLADYIRHNDQNLLEGSKRILKDFEEKYLPCESFDEFCDVTGMGVEGLLKV